MTYEYAPGVTIPYACADPNDHSHGCTGKTDGTAPFYVYKGSPLRGVLDSSNPLQNCGPTHFARDLAPYRMYSDGSKVSLISEGEPVFAADTGKTWNSWSQPS